MIELQVLYLELPAKCIQISTNMPEIVLVTFCIREYLLEYLYPPCICIKSMGNGNKPEFDGITTLFCCIRYAIS